MEEPDLKALMEQGVEDMHAFASLCVVLAVPGKMSRSCAGVVAEEIEGIGKGLTEIGVDQAHFRICAQHLRDYARGVPSD